MAERGRLRREVLRLVLLALAVHGAFIATYFAGHVRAASRVSKLIFTGVWTIVTLGVVVVGLGRIRAVRQDGSGSGPE
jgi:hypothetical protein